MFEEAIDLPRIERKEALESMLVAIAGPEEPTIGQRYRAMSLIEKTLSKDIKPIELSAWVFDLDSQWVTTDTYPDWLGELWNTLDWCDDSWTLANPPHLEKSLSDILVSLAELDPIS